MNEAQYARALGGGTRTLTLSGGQRARLAQLVEVSSQLYATQLRQVQIWKTGDEDLVRLGRVCVSLANQLIDACEEETRNGHA